MIRNEIELETTLQRIQWFLTQIRHMRQVGGDPATYRASAGGFLAEIGRMQLEVREYLSFLPSEMKVDG